MLDHSRDQQFVRSLRDWGLVFMLTIWLESIMVSAIATKVTGTSRRAKVLAKEYKETRHDLMKKGLAGVWREFVHEFPGEISTEEDLMADMIILIRNQLAHCHISGGHEFALFIPTSSQKRLDRLKSAGWVRKPDDAASNPEALIIREGDREWFDRNTAMIFGFAENTILRLTRAYGIDDSEIC